MNKVLIYSAVGWIVCSSPGSRANNIYSSGSDNLTEVQLYMSASCQPGSRVIRVFSDVKKPSNLKIKEGFSTSEKVRIGSRVNRFY